VISFLGGEVFLEEKLIPYVISFLGGEVFLEEKQIP
jgi:hypothetical protein